MIIDFLGVIYNMYIEDPIPQTIGFIAMILMWIAFLHRDDVKTIKILVVAWCFWWLMFFLLESYAWLWATMITLLRLILSMKYKKNIKVFLFVIILATLMWIITFKSYYSLLPVLSSFIWAYSFFYLSWILLRVWSLVMSSLWLVYAIHIWALSWILNEIVLHILLISVIYKYYWVNWHKIHFLSKVKSIIHPLRNLDYWEYTIVKDRYIILPEDSLRKRIKVWFLNVIEKTKIPFKINK